MFLQRLPRDIRVLLKHEDHSNLGLLAAKADHLIAFRSCTDTIAIPAAADDPQDGLVAALPGKSKHPQQQLGSKQEKRQPLPVPPRWNKEKNPTAPVTLARDFAGLCFCHWIFSNKANNRTAPCSL